MKATNHQFLLYVYVKTFSSHWGNIGLCAEFSQCKIKQILTVCVYLDQGFVMWVYQPETRSLPHCMACIHRNQFWQQSLMQSWLLNSGTLTDHHLGQWADTPRDYSTRAMPVCLWWHNQVGTPRTWFRDTYRKW